MDVIVITDLAVLYRVGVGEAERAQPQNLLLSLELGCDFTAAAARDDLARTIDYSEVCRRLLGFGHGRSWKLLETLAVDIAALIRSEFGAKRVAVEIKKFIIPEAASVGVRIER